MICCVCLNPALDKVYNLDELKVGGVNRPKLVLSVPSGKGINVAKVAHSLGGNVCATGFLPTSNGYILTNELDRRGILHRFVEVPGELRQSQKLIDSSTKNVTEIVEPGVAIQDEHAKMFLVLMQELARGCDFVVLSGSLPRNLDTDFYAQLIKVIHKEGSRAVLDSSGEPFRRAIDAHPYMIKPNIHELSELMNRSLNSIDDVADAAMELVQIGIKFVLVSMGSDGALLCTAKERWVVRPPKISVVNTVGCGDSLVAGFVANFNEDDLEGALRAGVAAGSANALSYEVGEVNPDDYLNLLEQLEVTYFNL